MKKAFVFLLVLAIAISTVFAAGAKESADGGKKTITIGAESWEINKLFLEHAAEEFEAAHPDVEVEIVTIADQTKLANYILDWGRGTTDVDLVFLDGGIFSVEYASKGLIYDFEKDLDFFADFPKSKFTPGSLETGFIKGGQYGLPVIYEVYGISINKAMFEEAGLLDENGDPLPIKTWDDFYNAAEKLTKKDSSGTVTQVGGTIQFGNNLHIILGSAIYAQFGDAYAEDGITYNVDNDYVRNMIGAWQKGIQNGYLSQATFVDNAGGRNGFKAGQIAMCFEAAGRWMEAVDTIGVDNLALLPIPGDFGGTVCFGCQMVIPKASKNADLVCQFIKEALYGEYVQVNTFGQYGKMSVIQEYFDKALDETPIWNGIADSMSKAQPLKEYEESQKFLNGLNQIFQGGLVSTTTTPADMVNQILDLSASIRK